MVKSSLDVKTLDVKIYELREEPENLQLLLDVISMIYEQHEELAAGDAKLKDFDVVNYILAAALKADKISSDDLGLVLVYLMEVQAPSIYFQYAILRVH